MATETVQERLRHLHMDPVFEVGAPLRETISRRSANLKGIVIEKPTPLPPVEWIVAGVAVVCLVLVIKEERKA